MRLLETQCENPPESQEWEKDLRLRDLETLGQKRTRKSGMGKGFNVWGIKENRPKKTRESGMEK